MRNFHTMPNTTVPNRQKISRNFATVTCIPKKKNYLNNKYVAKIFISAIYKTSCQFKFDNMTRLGEDHCSLSERDQNAGTAIISRKTIFHISAEIVNWSIWQPVNVFFKDGVGDRNIGDELLLGDKVMLKPRQNYVS